MRVWAKSMAALAEPTSTTAKPSSSKRSAATAAISASSSTRSTGRPDTVTKLALRRSRYHQAEQNTKSRDSKPATPAVATAVSVERRNLDRRLQFDHAAPGQM